LLGFCPIADFHICSVKTLDSATIKVAIGKFSDLPDFTDQNLREMVNHVCLFIYITLNGENFKQISNGQIFG